MILIWPLWEVLYIWERYHIAYIWDTSSGHIPTHMRIIYQWYQSYIMSYQTYMRLMSTRVFESEYLCDPHIKSIYPVLPTVRQTSNNGLKYRNTVIEAFFIEFFKNWSFSSSLHSSSCYRLHHPSFNITVGQRFNILKMLPISKCYR